MLKRYDDEGRQEADLPLVHWGVQDAMYQAEQAIDDLLANFPNRFVAGALRVVIFPTGRHHLAPSDKLDHKVAKILRYRAQPALVLVGVNIWHLPRITR